MVQATSPSITITIRRGFYPNAAFFREKLAVWEFDNTYGNEWSRTKKSAGFT